MHPKVPESAIPKKDREWTREKDSLTVAREELSDIEKMENELNAYENYNSKKFDPDYYSTLGGKITSDIMQSTDPARKKELGRKLEIVKMLQESVNIVENPGSVNDARTDILKSHELIVRKLAKEKLDTIVATTGDNNSELDELKDLTVELDALNNHDIEKVSDMPDESKSVGHKIRVLGRMLKKIGGDDPRSADHRSSQKSLYKSISNTLTTETGIPSLSENMKRLLSGLESGTLSKNKIIDISNQLERDGELIEISPEDSSTINNVDRYLNKNVA